jgi:hypothetical protein
MKTASFNPNLVPPVTGLILAVSCDWDKVRILSIAIEALIDANGHAETKQLSELLERIRREE